MEFKLTHNEGRAEATSPLSSRGAGVEDHFVTVFLAILATALVFGAMLRMQPVSGANDGSRWNTVWSLVNGQGYVIDEAPYSTIDKVRRDGHFYSSKPPLMPTLLAGPAWLLRAAGVPAPQHDYVVNRFLLTLVNIIPFGLFVFLYGRLLDHFPGGLPARLFCLGAAGFGTYLTAYSVTLNNHTQGALAAFFALYGLIRIKYDGRKEWYWFALCGLFTSWAFVSEMVALPFALIVLGYLLRGNPHPSQAGWHDARRTLLYFVPVAAVMAAAYFATLYLSTGGFVPYYLLFDTELYQYEGSYWSNPRGIDALAEPKWFYAFNVLIGHHGVFSLTPLFLLGFYGMVKDRAFRPIHRTGLFLSAALFVFYVLRTNNYGGVCQGARWLFWLIPFWLLGLAAAVRDHFHSPRFRAFALLALLVSVLSVGHALSGNRNEGRPGPWSASWLHLIMRTAGWVGY